jgi:hypothetical protein
VIRKKFIAMSKYIKNTGRSQINDLMLHLNNLENNNLNPKLVESETNKKKG